MSEQRGDIPSQYLILLRMAELQDVEGKTYLPLEKLKNEISRTIRSSWVIPQSVKSLVEDVFLTQEKDARRFYREVVFVQSKLLLLSQKTQKEKKRKRT